MDEFDDEPDAIDKYLPPLTPVLILAASMVWVIWSELRTPRYIDGHVDDAPWMAAGALLFLSPVFYIALVGCQIVVLKLAGANFRRITAGYLGSAVLFGAFLAVLRPEDAAFEFIGGFGLAAAGLIPAACTTWALLRIRKSRG